MLPLTGFPMCLSPHEALPAQFLLSQVVDTFMTPSAPWSLALLQACSGDSGGWALSAVVNQPGLASARPRAHVLPWTLSMVPTAS